MKEFLLALLFAKTVLLTPHPVSFENHLELISAGPLKAISSGADIEIQVTPMITMEKNETILELRKRIKDTFSSGAIEAHLLDRSGNEVILNYRGSSSFSKNDVWLILEKEGGTPTDTEFVKVVIESKLLLKDVIISWNNYKK